MMNKKNNNVVDKKLQKCNVEVNRTKVDAREAYVKEINGSEKTFSFLFAIIVFVMYKFVAIYISIVTINVCYKIKLLLLLCA